VSARASGQKGALFEAIVAPASWEASEGARDTADDVLSSISVLVSSSLFYTHHLARHSLTRGACEYPMSPARRPDSPSDSQTSSMNEHLSSLGSADGKKGT
jgi:hypothetical protein